MRLFYLHEPQQTRNQNVLAQLRTQQLLPSLIPGMAGLAFADHSLSPSGGQSNTGLVSTPVSTTEQPSQQQQGTFGRAGGSGDVVSAGDGSSGQNAQGAKKGEGAGGEGAAAGVQGEERPAGGDVTPGSGRSSLDKDQGPVVSTAAQTQLEWVSVQFAIPQLKTSPSSSQEWGLSPGLTKGLSKVCLQWPLVVCTAVWIEDGASWCCSWFETKATCKRCRLLSIRQPRGSRGVYGHCFFA